MVNLSKPVIAVVGPTATGKTALAAEIAKWLQSEVISADSQLIYRELDIGTAKPSEAEKQGVPHHMIDVVAPDEVYSVAQYKEEATVHLERLWQAGKVPVVAGGTGFYIKALLESEFIPTVPPNPAFREKMAALPAAALHALLAEKDPQRAADLHPNDQVRIIRALEIIEATGRAVPRQAAKKDLSVQWLGLTYADRDLHRSLIAKRVDQMLAAGWLEEVAGLVSRYGPDAQALQVAHGYPELVAVTLGKQTLQDAKMQICINVRQYARRQRTWFRRNPNILWLERDRIPWPDLLKSAYQSIKEMGLLPA
ncbi:MAG TPA: tRNA (adenosine(37)-N6)-dimethylallyltransferase MiaA [Oculatellaceae cyanobacterium]|jgi:tRNA dimethylallyltransferase